MPFDPDRPAYFICPEYLPLSGSPRPVIDPATLAPVGRIAEATDAETAAVLAAANRAQAGWRRLDVKSRAKTLHELASRIEAADHRAAAILMSREIGKPYPEAIGEIANVAPVFRYYAEMARDEAGKVAGSTQEGPVRPMRTRLW